MQSKSIEVSLEKSKFNQSIPSQSTVSNHGIEKSQLRSHSSLSSLDENSRPSKVSKNDCKKNIFCADDDATLQRHSNQVWPDKGMTFQPISIRDGFTRGDKLVSSFLKVDREAEFDVNSKKKRRPSVTLLLDAIPNEILTKILSYLPASSITATALVSRRFYVLVTTPHVWRAAFSRSFQGPYKYGDGKNQSTDKTLGNLDESHSELRLFSRLTAQASWRTEYILRTRLLHNLERGKPPQSISNSSNSSHLNNKSKITNSTLTFSSHLTATVSHIHAVFDSEKHNPRFIHGASETSSITFSDSANGKIGKWRLSDSEVLSRFSEVWAGNPQYGLGDGPVGVPNSMDISLLYGVIIGEGIPAGRMFYQSSNEMRGHYLNNDNLENHEIGIPRIPESIEGVSAVWVAKSHSIPKMTNGLIGMLRGSTLGVVTAYSSGFDIGQTKRIPKGFPIAKWVLSPGVPIIAFDIDESYNSRRKECERVWAVALNALGEVFYLRKTPSSELLSEYLEVDVSKTYAWNIGRTVSWGMIEDSRRTLRDDPYHTLEINSTYFPRSSSHVQNLSQAQLEAEAHDIETYFQYTPSQFRKTYDNWDMKRRLHVDFASDDGTDAGEAVFVIKPGTLPKQQAEVKRMTRIGGKKSSTPLKIVHENQLHSETTIPLLKSPHYSSLNSNSIMKVCNMTISDESSIMGSKDILHEPKLQTDLETEIKSGKDPIGAFDQWRSTIFSLHDNSRVEITSSAIDMSAYALLTVNEDPMSYENPGFDFSYLDRNHEYLSGLNSIPGSRARFLVVGTNTGSLIIWNMRGPLSQNASSTNELRPFRKIYTDSPKISSVAVSALYIVHGGNDGLVQAWDPLVSKSQPIRTIHSRSSQIRRRITRNETPFGPGISNSAAGTILLDHNPMRLRGIVSIGTQLRYWSYSSTVDEIIRRRRRRPHERCSNGGPDRFSKNGRGAMRDYINTEREYFKKDEIEISRESAHLQGRFGVGICGLTEEEAVRYAELVSAEEFEKNNGHLKAKNSQSFDFDIFSESSSSKDGHNTSTSEKEYIMSSELDRDLLEAIRLSLLEK